MSYFNVRPPLRLAATALHHVTLDDKLAQCQIIHQCFHQHYPVTQISPSNDPIMSRHRSSDFANHFHALELCIASNSSWFSEIVLLHAPRVRRRHHPLLPQHRPHVTLCYAHIHFWASSIKDRVHLTRFIGVSHTTALRRLEHVRMAFATATYIQHVNAVVLGQLDRVCRRTDFVARSLRQECVRQT